LAFLLLALFIVIISPGAYQLARPDLQSITLFAIPIVFEILSIAATMLAIWSFRFRMSRAIRLHSLLVSLACLGVTGYLAYWGQIGLRPWAPW
jgi:hypothetical protein